MQLLGNNIIQGTLLRMNKIRNNVVKHVNSAPSVGQMLIS